MSSPLVPPIHNHYLELPSPTSTRVRAPTTPSQRLPPTALFHGPHSRNGSHSSLNPQDRSSPNDSKQASQQPQHLPRADPPTASFSDPRSSLVNNPRLQPANARPRDDADYRADALWTEMQKTLTDVELSAMNSSHVFSSTHAKALEELRTAQLSLAQAWAKSEADEMGDEDFDKEVSIGAMKGTAAGLGTGIVTTPKTPGRTHSRTGSTKSTPGRNLEEETERDIMLARRRREANDRYFQQVHRGVLDVVSKLDNVANAMRKVEKESRDIWNDDSAQSDSGLSDEREDVAETDGSMKMADTDTDGLGDSPVSPKFKRP